MKISKPVSVIHFSDLSVQLQPAGFKQFLRLLLCKSETVCVFRRVYRTYGKVVQSRENILFCHTLDSRQKCTFERCISFQQAAQHDGKDRPYLLIKAADQRLHDRSVVLVDKNFNAFSVIAF